MADKSTVGVIFIGTDNYTQFLPMWIKSVYTNLSVDTDRTVLLFTDEPERSAQVCVDYTEAGLSVRTFAIEHKPWPMVTLQRYANLLKYRDTLQDLDYLIYLDADMDIIQHVTLEMLLGGKELFGVVHPGIYMGDAGDIERDQLSQACIANWDPSLSFYCQGCLWGGRADFFWDLVETCAKWTDMDWNNKIIPRWHDESYLNRYMFEHRDEKNLVSPAYAYPETWRLPMEAVIIHKHKSQMLFPRFPGGSVAC